MTIEEILMIAKEGENFEFKAADTMALERFGSKLKGLCRWSHKSSTLVPR